MTRSHGFVGDDDADESGGGGGSADGADAATADKVDTVFYVMQTSLRRAAHTCDGGIAAAAVKHAAALLQKLLLGQLQRQLEQSISRKLAGAALAAAGAGLEGAVGKVQLGGAGGALAVSAASAVSAAGAKQQLGTLRTLSALHLCVSYAPRLWKQAADDFARSLPPQAAEMARGALADAAKAEQAFTDALDRGLKKLSSELMPRLRVRLDAFGAASYTLQTEAAFAAAEGDTFVAGLVAELEASMRPLSPHLAEGAREALLQLLIQACAERLEALVLAKRFDGLGALQLDRDVRALTKRLGELSSRSVREQLARLTQMCTLLNLEAEAEAEEVWEGGSGWKLSAAEAKKVLALRIDFHAGKIRNLTL